MNTFIVLDLEWNSSPEGKGSSNEKIPFEIIEIGAIKLNENLKELGRFRRIIRPVVYKEIHYRIRDVINLDMSQLKARGVSFKSAIKDFFEWIYADGDNPTLCTWGSMDLTELQRNMAYFKVNSPFAFPLIYYDLQKMYGISKGLDKRVQMPLDKAVMDSGITVKDPFHFALIDAQYTSMLMKKMDLKSVREYSSVDYFTIPKNKKEEIYIEYPTYSKYVSRAFEYRDQALSDRTVTEIICPICHRRLKKKIRWFSSNQKNYLSVSNCPEHGYVKGKIRLKNHEDELYIVKTVKPVSEDVFMEIRNKRLDFSKKTVKKNKLKKLKIMEK